ncbi:MAG TPA: DNA-directed RNA polymerase subunit D [Candidatus Thalassarchaeaceae archaeon]|nr:DNA-directed RNA polymerase subunit D [Candidatus Thalassarchaeaceae archaeon]|tara:strand:+ start:2355 stop:3242 length:888 start_codon:yes stop_codon:yes gene_type:complete
MVKIKIIKESEERMQLLLAETDRSFANAVRRTLISDTPKMAIDSVRFQLGTKEQGDEMWETTGPLPDEMIAQRLAMVPIPTEHDRFHFQDSCPNCKDLVESDRGCLECQMIYTCIVFGTEEGRWVTAGDMKFLGEESLEISPAYQSIQITKLLNGQMIEFYATAVMGRGRDHTKWTPVCGVSFSPRKVAILKNKKKAKVLWDMDLQIKAKDFGKDSKIDDIEMVAILDKELNHVRGSTVASRDFSDAIVMEEVPGEFILDFETDGSMTPRVAFMKATEELGNEFSMLQQEISSAL